MSDNKFDALARNFGSERDLPRRAVLCGGGGGVALLLGMLWASGTVDEVDAREGAAGGRLGGRRGKNRRGRDGNRKNGKNKGRSTRKGANPPGLGIPGWIYVRMVVENLTAADVEPIARGQTEVETAAERSALATGARLIVLDTDLVSTVVYAMHYYRSCPDWIVRAARERRADLYLLLAPDLPWVADGVRDRPENREEMHEAFRACLQRVDARVVEIGGSGPDRLARALRAIEEALSPIT